LGDTKGIEPVKGVFSGLEQSWKTPGEVGLNKFVECDILPFSALTLLVGHPACKKTGCWFVGGDDLTGALHDFAPVVTTHHFHHP